MNTIFMISENSKTSDFHALLLNLSVEIYLNGGINMLFYQISAYIIHVKKDKKVVKKH